MPTVKDNFKVLHGLEVENDNRESILSSDDTSLISERTAYLRGNTASDPALVVESRSGQSTDLQQWKDDAGQTIVRVDENGKIFAQDLQTVSDVTIGGDLVVQGTTTTIESVIATVQDPILLIGGETPPTADDNKDRGIEFRWHDGSDAKIGFFGFKDSDGKFTFVPDSGNLNEVISGSPGDVLFNNADLNGDLAVNGGSITTSTGLFNLVDENASTVNFARDAVEINIGSTSGTTTINHNLQIIGNRLSSTSASFDFLDTTNAITIGSSATSLGIGSSSGTTQVNNDLNVSGDLKVFGGDLTVGSTVFNLANTSALTINFGGNATDIQIGATTGITNINNNLDVDGDTNIDGGDLTTNQSTFNLLNTNANTINFAGAATDVQIGSSTGTTNVNNDLSVDGDFDSVAATFNILASPTTINFGAAATDVQIGSSTGTTNVNNDLDVDGDVSIDGTTIATTSLSFDLLDTIAETVNFARTATDLTMGADTGNTTIRNNLIVDDNLTINGLTTTFNPSIANPPFTLGANAIDQFVEGLNADLLDDQEGSWYQARANHTGTQLHTTISDWEEAVEDTVAPMFVHSQQSGIVAQYNDETGRILLTVAGGGGGGATDFGMIYWMGV